MFRFKDIDHIKRVNARTGHYFFSPDTMYFFNSTVYDQVYGGRFFVTRVRVGGSFCSSYRPSESDFGYKVRQARKNGSILAVGPFETKAEAVAEAKKAADKFGHNGGAHD